MNHKLETHNLQLTFGHVSASIAVQNRALSFLISTTEIDGLSHSYKYHENGWTHLRDPEPETRNGR